jgi:hypothetical protein
MGDIYTTRWYRVWAPTGGSVEFPISGRFVDGMDTEHEVVAHEAWRVLFDIPQHNKMNEERNSVSRILKGLCDTHGVEYVKKKFTTGIVFERIR